MVICQKISRNRYQWEHDLYLITVYPHLLMLSLLFEIVYNVLKEGRGVNIKLCDDIAR